VWFGQDEEGEKLAEARAAGQRVVFRRKGRLVFVIGAEETVLSGLVIPPVLAEQPVALLAAAAAAWALGMQPKRIGAGIESFALD
jgi:cyanophycin synthetase